MTRGPRLQRFSGSTLYVTAETGEPIARYTKTPHGFDLSSNTRELTDTVGEPVASYLMDAFGSGHNTGPPSQ
ncbi:MAG TPA: hypothetical protein VGK19_20065 [Capsulimonadaceae bacterium]|jgi:hypothetical protein